MMRALNVSGWVVGLTLVVIGCGESPLGKDRLVGMFQRLRNPSPKCALA